MKYIGDDDNIDSDQNDESDDNYTDDKDSHDDNNGYDDSDDKYWHDAFRDKKVMMIFYRYYHLPYFMGNVSHETSLQI